MKSLPQNKISEWRFSANGEYADPFNDVEVTVCFQQDGSDVVRRVPAFWAGGREWRVRFASPRTGTFRFRTECSNVADSGLHAQEGACKVVPYKGRNPLYRHGRVRVAESSRTLEHTDGTPFLWVADTWWMGLTKRLDWPDGFRELVADRVRKGFNAVQIVAGPLPDFCATTATWDPQQANEAGWPWEKDFARINPAFYDVADQRFVHMIEQGLMPCIVGMWGYYLPFMGVERCKRHWRYLVARYGAYPVTWCLCGECTMPTYANCGKPEGERDMAVQKAGWTDVARYVRQIDPFRNCLTVHPSSSGRLSLADETLLDLDMLQTGHHGYQSLRPSADAMQAAVNRLPRMPVLNSEVNYEGIMGGSKDEVQRFLFWASLLQGACGHTYGAQGIWAMSSRHQPFKGTTGSWGDGFWKDVMHYPGSSHVGMGAQILRRYPWWRLEPCEEPAAAAAGHPYSFAARIPGELIVVYLPCSCFPSDVLGNQPGWGGPFPLRIEPGARYRADYLDPRTGESHPIGAVVAEGGQWTPPRKPGMEDWVLILEAT